MSKLDLDKPVQTRSGQFARIVSRDVAGPYPLAALIKDVNDQEYPRTYTIDGKFNLSRAESPLDLINVPEPATEYLFIGGVADGRRIAVPDDTRQYSVPVPGGGTEEYRRAHLSSFTQARYVFVSSKTNGTGALDELIEQYPAAIPAGHITTPAPVPAESPWGGVVGASGGDGVVGVRGITSVRDIFLVWTYYSGESAMLRAAHVTRRAADDAAQNYAMILPPGQGAYVTKQSLYE